MDKNTHLNKIMEVDFACVDLNLYLDTHPNCPHALELLRQYSQESMTLTASYEQKFGPLTSTSATATAAAHYNWINSPWPWQRTNT